MNGAILLPGILSAVSGGHGLGLIVSGRRGGLVPPRLEWRACQ
jgi:hypothetical protein